MNEKNNPGKPELGDIRGLMLCFSFGTVSLDCALLGRDPAIQPLDIRRTFLRVTCVAGAE